MKIVRYSIAIVVLLCMAFPAMGTQSIFSYVKASPYGDEVLLQWETMEETGIKSFEIERKSDETIDYRMIARIDPKGRHSAYNYIDNGAFYKTESGKHFTYRLKAVGGTTDQFSPAITITHEVSGVRKSWGMIKELFR
ncbi:MAG: hypothetical protein ABIR47_02665 [Candidatus Kapaibacterium sp.]